MPARARRYDPRTSHDAAGSISEYNISQCRAIILGILRSEGDQIHEEIIANERWHTFPQAESSIRTRCSELVRMGLVWPTSKRRVTKSGHAAIVWTANPPAITLVPLNGAPGARRIQPYRGEDG
jgi:hypothetical protein